MWLTVCETRLWGLSHWQFSLSATIVAKNSKKQQQQNAESCVLYAFVVTKDERYAKGFTRIKWVWNQTDPAAGAGSDRTRIRTTANMPGVKTTFIEDLNA